MWLEIFPASLWHQLSEEIQMSGLLWRWWSGWSTKESEDSHLLTAGTSSLPTPQNIHRCYAVLLTIYTPDYCWVHEEKPPPICSSDSGWILHWRNQGIITWTRAAGRSLVQLVIQFYGEVSALHHLLLRLWLVEGSLMSKLEHLLFSEALVTVIVTVFHSHLFPQTGSSLFFPVTVRP